MVNEVIFGYWKEDLTHLVPPSGSSLISLTPPREDGTQGQRCDAFEFDIPVPDILSPTLQVLSISAYPREGQSCQVYQERVQPALDEQITGIQISCEEQPHTSTMTIDRLPEGMSLETAEAIVYQVFKDAISIYGPWKFDLSPSAAPSEDIPDVADLQPLLADLRELKALRVQTFFSKPGWLHTQAQEGWDTASNAPDGSPLPSDYLTDEWFALDENGRITISVVRNLDLHGNILYTQVSRAEASLAWEDMYTLPAMDYGFTDIAESWGKVSKPISSQPAVIDDVAIGDRYILQDEGSRIEAIYDPGTGQLLSMKTYEVTPDGLKLIQAVSILVMEKFAEAPLEILNLVNSTPSTP